MFIFLLIMLDGFQQLIAFNNAANAPPLSIIAEKMLANRMFHNPNFILSSALSFRIWNGFLESKKPILNELGVPAGMPSFVVHNKFTIQATAIVLTNLNYCDSI